MYNAGDSIIFLSDAATVTPPLSGDSFDAVFDRIASTLAPPDQIYAPATIPNLRTTRNLWDDLNVRSMDVNTAMRQHFTPYPQPGAVTNKVWLAVHNHSHVLHLLMNNVNFGVAAFAQSVNYLWIHSTFVGFGRPGKMQGPTPYGFNAMGSAIHGVLPWDPTSRPPRTYQEAQSTEWAAYLPATTIEAVVGAGIQPRVVALSFCHRSPLPFDTDPAGYRACPPSMLIRRYAVQPQEWDEYVNSLRRFTQVDYFLLISREGVEPGVDDVTQVREQAKIVARDILRSLRDISPAVRNLIASVVNDIAIDGIVVPDATGNLGGPDATHTLRLHDAHARLHDMVVSVKAACVAVNPQMYRRLRRMVIDDNLGLTSNMLLDSTEEMLRVVENAEQAERDLAEQAAANTPARDVHTRRALAYSAWVSYLGMCVDCVRMLTSADLTADATPLRIDTVLQEIADRTRKPVHHRRIDPMNVHFWGNDLIVEPRDR